MERSHRLQIGNGNRSMVQWRQSSWKMRWWGEWTWEVTTPDTWPHLTTSEHIWPHLGGEMMGVEVNLGSERLHSNGTSSLQFLDSIQVHTRLYNLHFINSRMLTCIYWKNYRYLLYSRWTKPRRGFSCLQTSQSRWSPSQSTCGPDSASIERSEQDSTSWSSATVLSTWSPAFTPPSSSLPGASWAPPASACWTPSPWCFSLPGTDWCLWPLQLFAISWSAMLSLCRTMAERSRWVSDPRTPGLLDRRSLIWGSLSLKD